MEDGVSYDQQILWGCSTPRRAAQVQGDKTFERTARVCVTAWPARALAAGGNWVAERKRPTTRCSTPRRTPTATSRTCLPSTPAGRSRPRARPSWLPPCAPSLGLGDAGTGWAWPGRWPSGPGCRTATVLTACAGLLATPAPVPQNNQGLGLRPTTTAAPTPISSTPTRPFQIDGNLWLHGRRGRDAAAVARRRAAAARPAQRLEHGQRAGIASARRRHRGPGLAGRYGPKCNCTRP